MGTGGILVCWSLQKDESAKNGDKTGGKRPRIDVNFVTEKGFEARAPSIPLISHSKGVTLILIGQRY